MKSKETIESFNDAISRILTMSLIHQKMYEKDSLVDIKIENYLKTLVDDLVNTNVTSMKVEHHITSSLESVGAKSIVPLGLIINELVSNSLKHAFSEQGMIELNIEPLNSSKMKMVYFDNGQWKESNEASFGLQLIEVFTDQLEGSFERTVDETGTTYIFEFSNIDE